ncbi:DNA polymerase III subunit alpha [Buchnera aphidicola (Eriosoma grossulariae)]|uniref:DNA polymerase III subunit alpha n=1 Tax=Buchnera aphidicola TaxID=9 RepID=UPI0034640DBD
MYNTQFVHLRIHSDYSLIDGLSKPDKLVQHVSNLNFPAMAITDFGNFYGIIKFYKSAYLAGIKPIIGVDVNIRSNIFPNKLTKLTLFAANNQGYYNLIILISMSYQKGYKNSILSVYIEQEWLLKYKNGLIILSGGIFGDLGMSLLTNNNKLIFNCISFYKKYFPDNYYIELTRTNRINEDIYCKKAVLIALKTHIPVVATNDVRFINKEDFDAHNVRVAVQKGISINSAYLLQEYTCEQYLKTEDEMCKLFSDIPQALFNTVELAKRCNVTIRLGEYFLPQFPTGKMNTKNFLILKSKAGLEKRLKIIYPDKNLRILKRKKYDLRLDNELNVINKMGFPGYFLIVMEFIQWSKNNNIPVGPGRGSGAGSLVAYALNITELDPLSFDLLFERFLNSERISLPDLDIDFCIQKRDQVIEHVASIYGRDSVSQIITFGTMTARAVIKDVGRTLGYPYGFLNRVSKLIPLDLRITLDKALSTCSELNNLYKINPDVKILINIAKKLEGVTRNISKHAGGVVISPTKIINFSPLYYDETGNNQVTQFDKNDIENVGLLKFDFLGLRTLTIIHSAVKMINNNYYNQEKNNYVDINLISLNDKKCFNYLQKAKTTAVFQLESTGMKDLIKRLKPDTFEDIIALVALFRPGPLQSGMVDNFINRKHGLEKIYFPDKKWQHILLKPILESTYGVILYQEQVMKIAQVLAGYTLGHADIFRRAMGKKNPEEMSRQRSIFQAGAQKNGINSNLSIKIFDLLEKFAGYGFNKSHSAAYALVSYQTLWLKVNYPSEFLSSAMNSEIDNTNKLMILIDEVFTIGIVVLPPDVNYSEFYFYVNQKKEIIYGLGAIKGIGKNIILSILESRKKFGKFNDIFDFCLRLDSKKITRRILLKLIMSGSFDSFNIHRSALVDILNNVIYATKQYIIEKTNKQNNIFGNIHYEFQKITKSIIQSSSTWSEKQKLNFEKETLGIYLTGHPINEYLYELLHYTRGFRIKDVFLIIRNKTSCIIAGIVTDIKKKITKNNDNFYILQIDDKSHRIEVIIFSNLIKKYHNLLFKDNILIIKGYVVIDKVANYYKIIAVHIINLDTARQKYVKKIVLFLNIEMNELFLSKLYKILEKYVGGPIPIYISYQNKKKVFLKFPLNIQWCVFPNEKLISDINIMKDIKKIQFDFK